MVSAGNHHFSLWSDRLPAAIDGDLGDTALNTAAGEDGETHINHLGCDHLSAQSSQ